MVYLAQGGVCRIMHEVTETRSLPSPDSIIPFAPPVDHSPSRPYVRGKFLYVGHEKLWIRGVTYGTFRPDQEGHLYPHPDLVERDFAQMSENGFNAIRTYTAPPRWLLDTAHQHGLRIMIGLEWDQYITFLDDPKRIRAIETLWRDRIRTYADHPAVLCYTLGNEIPAPIVRWYGHRRIERFLEALYHVTKTEDPGGLVTYVNYPTTEYLHLPFLDLVCFNVYLEDQDRLEAYLARLQNLAGDRPLVMGEIGLDSRTHGEAAQAAVLDWQIRTAFAAGCAGAFMFAWTDEWHRGGYDIEDWDFGLTQRDRQPKLALNTVRNAFAEVPFPKDVSWPRISVVVCSYNGAKTIRDTLEGLLRLEYPEYEVIVIDDGSTDGTAAIAREYGFHLISTENRGLSNARNTGMQVAKGEIVAYIDDDAYPDRHWLTYLASVFCHTDHVGVGGPNLAPPGDGPIADCVANAPGGPVHVLITDREAEHIPGCNMAFRKATLQSIGGFDPRFRTAGDDVDVCWRLQQRGWTLGFHPSALVWHHRRNSVRAYWKQQKGYGKAEAMLEQKWPQKYNELGHLAWRGRLYGKGLTQALIWGRGRLYQGTWGSALFQSLYQPAPNTLHSLPLMPEWYLVIASLFVISALAIFWAPLLLALPVLAIAMVVPILQAVHSARQASFTTSPRTATARLKRYALTALLHLIQPVARLYGRLSHGLTPWRWRGTQKLVWPKAYCLSSWSEQWQDTIKRLEALEAKLRVDGTPVYHGGDFNRWDLEVRGGLMGSARTLMTIEEHGAGKQMVRVRIWPIVSVPGLGCTLLFAILAGLASLDHAWVSAMTLGAIALTLIARLSLECSRAISSLLQSIKQLGAGETA